VSRESIQPENVAVPSPPFSPVVASGELVITAGQVGYDEDGKLVGGGIREQTQQTLTNLERCLSAAGCTLADVLKVTAFIADLADLEGYNEVYASFFDAPYPARSTVQVGLPPGLLIEIEATARRRQ
jgi:reactive intermediate/imine deaminase